MGHQQPYFISFNTIGDPSLGFISVAEKENLPFVPKRIYWTYATPERVVRGNHSHHQLEQVVVAVAGEIIITTELGTGEKSDFVLDNPTVGLYIPKMCWRSIRYSKDAVQMCIASMEYDESDYIRDYDTFLNTGSKSP